MRAWQLEEFGLEKLRLAEWPTPKPGPSEFFVKSSTARHPSAASRSVTAARSLR